MKFCFFFILLFASLQASVSYFIPPKGWQPATPKTPSPYIKVGFLGKGDHTFSPSINLASENTDVSLKEYVAAVKELLQAQDPHSKIRDLGKLEMQGGIGRLLEISSRSPFGELRMLQAVLVKNKEAHILTAVTLKEEFPKFQKELITSIKSLDITENIWSPLPQRELRQKLEGIFSSLGNGEDKKTEWDAFQKEIISIDEMGPYWQYLALQEGQKKIFSN